MIRPVLLIIILDLRSCPCLLLLCFNPKAAYFLSQLVAMSTQSPIPPTPKGSRNNRRNQKRNTTPYTQNATLLTTPPSSPPRNVSPAGTTTDSSNNARSSKKRGVRSGKKPRDIPGPSPANAQGHQRTSSQPNNINTPQLKDSPHYAGPTFHASPAPSALPIPSFFSKSVPESDLEPTLESEDENLEAETDLDITPSKPKTRPYGDHGQSSTPLDFLFKAAVQARNSQPQSPETEPKIRSPQTDSKAVPHRNYSGLSQGIFPLEMDNRDRQNMEIGPSFAPSYQDRMNALRSSSSPSQATADLDEDERRAKTEALKDLLLNPRPQRPPSSQATYNQASGSQGRPGVSPHVPHFATPLRTTSGPPATISHGFKRETKQPMAPMGGNAVRPLSAHTQNGQQQIRTPQSALRREVPSSGPGDMPGVQASGFSSPSAGYNQSNLTGHYAQRSSRASPVHPPPAAGCTVPAGQSPQSLDTKKMEDDLRRILKLDSIPPSGVQSSYA